MSDRPYTQDPTQDERYKQAVAYRWVQAWQTAIEVEAGLAPRTRLDYLRTVAVFVVRHDLEPNEWTHHHVADTLASFPEGSRRKVRAHLNSFLSWLEDEEVIERNPVRRLRKPRPKQQKVPDIFTEAEAAVMLADPLLTLMLNTGLRKGECRRLKRRHISLERAELRVIDGKGGKSRIVPLNLTAQRAIVELDTPPLGPDDHLWSSRPGGGSVVDRSRPVGEATFARWWKNALARLDIDYRNPHTARHTFATRWLRQGGRASTLQATMGHSKSSTTLDLYAHMDLGDARADALLMDRETV